MPKMSKIITWALTHPPAADSLGRARGLLRVTQGSSWRTAAVTGLVRTVPTMRTTGEQHANTKHPDILEQIR